MFGKNPVLKKEKGADGKMLRVVKGSPFYTLQGEGPFAGHPAVFIRLHGCNLRCWFCDTEFSDPDDPHYPIEALVDECLKHPTRLVVLTGGEPLRQNVVPLVGLLLANGFTVQFETSGTVWWEELAQFDRQNVHYIVSPKTGKVNDEVSKRAMAYKYIIDATDGEIGDDGLPISSTQVQGTECTIA